MSHRSHDWHGRFLELGVGLAKWGCWVTTLTTFDAIPAFTIGFSGRWSPAVEVAAGVTLKITCFLYQRILNPTFDLFDHLSHHLSSIGLIFGSSHLTGLLFNSRLHSPTFVYLSFISSISPFNLPRLLLTNYCSPVYSSPFDFSPVQTSPVDPRSQQLKFQRFTSLLVTSHSSPVTLHRSLFTSFFFTRLLLTCHLLPVTLYQSEFH
jgi:hypothetical protein